MSFLPYRPDEGSSFDPRVSRVPRCTRCNHVLDGEAEIAKAEICTSCQSILRLTGREETAERQRRIEETLE